MSLAVTKRDIGLLIGLVGVLLAVLAYNFAYTPYTEKTKTLETENKALEQRVQILQSLADQRDDMLDATKENNRHFVLTINNNNNPMLVSVKP